MYSIRAHWYKEAGLYKHNLGEIIFDYCNMFFMILFAVVCMYPFLYILVLSFNDGRDAMRGGIYLFPRVFSLENYITIFSDKRLWGSFGISVFRTVASIVLGVLINAMYAYAISKSDLPGRKFFNWLIVIPMYFGAGIIPYYLICQKLHLINNIWVYVLPWLAAPFHIMILRIAMKELPASLEESAQLDGAGYPKMFVQIILPLTLPSLATVSLLTGIFHWNDWLDGTIMATRSALWPLQTLLLNILQGSDMNAFFRSRNLGAAGGMVRKIAITPESLKMAMLVVTVLPIFMVYPFAQKYFIRGMLVGSVKE
jgi:putative aldouronate transport system permease protein